MKKRIHIWISVMIAAAMLFTGCAANKSSDSTSSSNTSSSTSSSSSSGSATKSTTSKVVVDKEYTASDLEVGFEDSSATHITFDGSNIKVSGSGATAKDGVLTISKKGTYVITGTLADGQIIVNAGKRDKVKIILNGVSITCSDSAPIYVKQADKVFITLEKNTKNTLTDGTKYVQTDKNTVDGVIFSKADLTINGEGTLNINGNYKHGIAVKDKLTITGGTYNISAVKSAISSNDGIRIKAGTFKLSSENGKGITSKNGEDKTKGYVYISGGDITVTKSTEGIEGTAIVVEGGTINVTSSDDGFNCASGTVKTSSTASTNITSNSTNDKFGRGGNGGTMENDTNCYLSISGGKITVNASGDGLDSNGSMYISGGSIYVSGPTNGGNGGLDYNGTANITGGTIIVAGSTGMAQGFSDTSTQYSVLYNLTSAVEGGNKITLKDSDGNVVAAYTPDKQYQSVVISTPDLKKGTYKLTCGSQTETVTISSVVTTGGSQQSSFHGMGGGHGGPGMGNQNSQSDNNSSTTTN